MLESLPTKVKPVTPSRSDDPKQPARPLRRPDGDFLSRISRAGTSRLSGVSLAENFFYFRRVFLLSLLDVFVVVICFQPVILTFTVHRQKTHSPDIPGALTAMVFKQGFPTTPFTECRGCLGTHTFIKGLSRSVIVGFQTPILLRRDYPVLYIVGFQTPILLRRDSPVL